MPDAGSHTITLEDNGLVSWLTFSSSKSLSLLFCLTSDMRINLVGSMNRNHAFFPVRDRGIFFSKYFQSCNKSGSY